jgi:hypothetical protein
VKFIPEGEGTVGTVPVRESESRLYTTHRHQTHTHIHTEIYAHDLIHTHEHTHTHTHTHTHRRWSFSGGTLLLEKSIPVGKIESSLIPNFYLSVYLYLLVSWHALVQYSI